MTRMPVDALWKQMPRLALWWLKRCCLDLVLRHARVCVEIFSHQSTADLMCLANELSDIQI